MSGAKILVLGFLLGLFAVVAAFLMVLRIIQPSFWLSFVVYGASIMCVFLGLIGAAYHIRRRRQ